MGTRFLLLIAMVAVTIAAEAQVKVKLGATTGANTTFLFDKGINTDPQYISVQKIDMAPFGFSVGVDFTKKFGLSLESVKANMEMIYQMKEQIANVETMVAERRIDMQYLHIPLLLNFLNGSDKRARMNFNFGPQLSILQKGAETFNLTPEAAGATLTIPENGENDLPMGAIDNGDGTYTMPDEIPSENMTMELLKKNAEDQIESFKNTEFHLLAGFGFDIDVGRYTSINMAIRGDYGITDMRNGEFIEKMKSESLESVFSGRSTLAVGARVGVTFLIGGNRFFNGKLGKGAKPDDVVDDLWR